MDTMKFDPETFTPLSNHVLVRRRKGADKTSSGALYLPETGKEPSEICDVLAVGPGYHEDNGFFQASESRVGQAVLIPNQHGHEFEADGEFYVVIREKHVLASIDEAA